MARVVIPRWLIALGAFALMASLGAAAVALRPRPPVDWRAALTTLSPHACARGRVLSVEAARRAAPPSIAGRCRSRGYGLPKQQNAAVAGRARGPVDPVQRGRTARALGSGGAPAWELPAAPSTLALPSE